MGGNNQGEGTVEICNNHIWGLIFDSGWNDSDAEVVCRQLGYQTLGELRIVFYACDIVNLIKCFTVSNSKLM